MQIIRTVLSSLQKRTITIVLFCFISVLFVTALYWQGLYGPFLLDDLQSIEPAKLKHFSWSEFLRISLENSTGPIGRPIPTATFALNDYFFGPAPFSFKAVNLVLHLLCGFAIGLFVYLLILLKPQAKRFAVPIAGLTALLWLIHPLQVSTVLYPVQRMTQLCHLFIIIGLNCYLYSRLQLSLHRSYRLYFALSILVFFPLALLSKETGVLFPWYLLCIEVFILRFHAPTHTQQRFLKIFHGVFSGGLLLGGAFYYWYKLPTFLAMYAEKHMTIIDRLLTQIKALVFYMQLIFFPRLSQMGLYHDDFPLATHFDLALIVSSIFLIACVVLIFICRRRAPIIAFGLSWFFISHCIESTILPLELVFEHRNYLAILGLLLIPVYYGVTTYAKLSYSLRRIAVIAAVSITLLFAGLTFYRSYTWSSTERFLIEAQFAHPLSPRTHIELANWLLNKKEYEKAFIELRIAEQLDPRNTGIVLQQILLHCRASAVPESLYQTAFAKMENGTITPYVIMVLDTLVRNMFEQQCQSVDRKKILELIEVALQNRYLSYKPVYKAVLLHLQAGLALLDNKPHQSKMLLLQSFEAAPSRVDPLVEKVYLELEDNQIAEAQKTADLLNKHANVLQAHQPKIRKVNEKLRDARQNQYYHPRQE